MDCSDFARAAGSTWQEKAEDACTNCTRCNGNFPINPDEKTEVFDLIGDFDGIIAEIAEIAADAKAGYKVDFQKIDYVRGSLYLIWDAAEREMQLVHQLRMQAFLKGWMQPKK